MITMKYVAKIQKHISRYQTLYTNRTTARVLDGSYKSVFKGRSLNFDELREYVPGDDIKDMDWKASARSQKMLVRQYIAEKKHNIMLVMDTNRRMLADSADGEEKRELAIMSGGMIACFVNRNGDYISSTFATEKSMSHFPFKAGLGNIELILEGYHKRVTMGNRSDINAPLEYIARNFQRRMIIVIVTDAQGVKDISESTLKRLLVAHDILLVQISDGKLNGLGDYDVEEGRYLDPFFVENKKLRKAVEKKQSVILEECEDKLKRFGITSVTVDSEERLHLDIMELLDKHKFEKR